MAAPAPAGSANKLGADSGSPKTIADFDATGRLILDQKACDDVFNRDDIRNMPVAICSVIGPIRLGKSFITNCILYQNQLEGDSGYKLMTTSAFFPSKSGVAKVSKGLMIWSEPIIIQRAGNKKMAIFLLDTEGLFEDGNPEKRDILIFALSARLSSIQLYFFDDRLKPSELDYLEYLVNSANNFVNPEAAGFQKIVYIVRNWESEEKHVFGRVGGSNYLKEFNNTHNTAWESINHRYNSVECILLPHPGEAVVGRTFFGYTAAIPKSFVDNVKELLAFIKGAGNVEPRNINGQPANSKAIVEDLKKTVDILNKTQIPDPVRLMQCVAMRDAGGFKKKYSDLYKKELTKQLDGQIETNTLKAQNMESVHERLRNQHLKAFDNEIRKSKTVDENEFARLEFEMEMNSIYTNLTALYLDKQKIKDLKEDNDKICDQYKTDINTKNEEIKKLRSESEKQIAAKDAEILKLMKEVEQKTQKEDDYINQLEQSLQTFETMDKKLKHSEQENEKLNNQLKTKLESENKSKALIDKLKTENANLKRDKQDIISNLNFEKEKSVDLQNEVKELSKRRSEIQNKCKELQNEVESTNNTLRQLQSDFQVKSNALQEAQNALAFSEGKLQSIQQKNREAEAKSKEYEQRAKEAEERASKAELKAQNAEKKLQNAEQKAHEEVEKARKTAENMKKRADDAEQRALVAENMSKAAEQRALTAEQGRNDAEQQAELAVKEKRDVEERALAMEQEKTHLEQRRLVAEGEKRDAEQMSLNAEHERLDADQRAQGSEQKARDVEERAREAETRAREAEEKRQDAEMRLLNALQKTQDAENTAKIAEQNALDAENKLKDEKQRADDAENKLKEAENALEVEQLQRKELQKAQEIGRNKTAVNIDQLNSSFDLQLSYYEELKKNGEQYMEELIKKRNETADILKTQKEDIEKQEVEDKDWKRNLVFANIICFIFLVNWMYNTNFTMLAQIGTAVTTFAIIAFDVFFFQGSAGSVEKHKRKELCFKLEEDGNRVMKLQKILGAMISSKEMLTKLQPLIQDQALLDKYKEATGTGPLKSEKLDKILNFLKNSVVLPTDQESLAYDMRMEENDFGRLGLIDIRKTLKAEVDKLKEFK